MKIQTLKTSLFIQNLSKLILLVLIFNASCSETYHNSQDKDDTIKTQIKLLSKFIENEQKNITNQLGDFYQHNEEYKVIKALDETVNHIFDIKDENNINEEYMKYITMCDSLYQNYGNNTLQRESILRINEWNDFVELEVLINQQIVQSTIISYIQKSFYKFHTVKPVVLPRKNEIKLGEEYYAEIYLAGIDTNFNYTISINGEQLPFKSNDNTPESYLPIFKITPTKKGLHKIEANMKLYHYSIQKYYNLPIEFEFEVK